MPVFEPPSKRGVESTVVCTVVLNGKLLLISRGVKLAEPRTTQKIFSTEEKAKAAFEQLINQLLADGFIKISDGEGIFGAGSETGPRHLWIEDRDYYLDQALKTAGVDYANPDVRLLFETLCSFAKRPVKGKKRYHLEGDQIEPGKAILRIHLEAGDSCTTELHLNLETKPGDTFLFETLVRSNLSTLIKNFKGCPEWNIFERARPTKIEVIGPARRKGRKARSSLEDSACSDAIPELSERLQFPEDEPD